MRLLHYTRLHHLWRRSPVTGTFIRYHCGFGSCGYTATVTFPYRSTLPHTYTAFVTTAFFLPLLRTTAHSAWLPAFCLLRFLTAHHYTFARCRCLTFPAWISTGYHLPATGPALHCGYRTAPPHLPTPLARRNTRCPTHAHARASLHTRTHCCRTRISLRPLCLVPRHRYIPRYVVGVVGLRFAYTRYTATCRISFDSPLTSCVRSTTRWTHLCTFDFYHCHRCRAFAVDGSTRSGLRLVRSLLRGSHCYFLSLRFVGFYHILRYPVLIYVCYFAYAASLCYTPPHSLHPHTTLHHIHHVPYVDLDFRLPVTVAYTPLLLR